MGPPRSSTDALAADHVLSVGDRFEMVRVHAERVAAQMIEVKALRDRAD
jgi:hypothetical protein